MASCIGAAAAGARTFTATSSQGLALMHEVLHYAAGARLPVVMVNANRAMAPPWNLYCDHTDSLAQRDTGWIQYYCADAQDVIDAVLIAYRVAEQALLPVMLNLDAFYLTHTSELVEVPDQEAADAFLPPYRPALRLDVDAPRTFGNVCGADLYTSIKFRRQQAILAVDALWQQAAEEFASIFGRLHPAVAAYCTEQAEIVLVALGTAGGAVQLAVDRLRDEGLAVGCIHLSLMRPFPVAALTAALGTAHTVVAVDRDVSFGAEGILAQELKAALFGHPTIKQIHGVVGGIGGNDVTADGVSAWVRQIRSGSGPAVAAGASLWAEVIP